MHGNVAEWCLDAWSPNAYHHRWDGVTDPVMTESNSCWNAEDDETTKRFTGWKGVLEKLIAGVRLDDDAVAVLSDLESVTNELAKGREDWQKMALILGRCIRTKAADVDDRKELGPLLQWSEGGIPQGKQVYRVVRGGSWYGTAGNCRSAFRGWNRPDGRFISFGFRVCLVRGPAASQNS